MFSKGNWMAPLYSSCVEPPKLGLVVRTLATAKIGGVEKRTAKLVALLMTYKLITL
jgi:hypothetical protein